MDYLLYLISESHTLVKKIMSYKGDEDEENNWYNFIFSRIIFKLYSSNHGGIS